MRSIKSTIRTPECKQILIFRSMRCDGERDRKKRPVVHRLVPLSERARYLVTFEQEDGKTAERAIQETDPASSP